MEGGDVSVHYDPMLAKVIVHAETRDGCDRPRIGRTPRVSRPGDRDEPGFLRAVLGHASFVRGDVDTGFLDRETPALVAAMAEAPVPDGALAAAAAELLARAEARDVGPAAVGESADPWDRRWPWIGA